MKSTVLGESFGPNKRSPLLNSAASFETRYSWRSLARRNRRADWVASRRNSSIERLNPDESPSLSWLRQMTKSPLRSGPRPPACSEVSRKASTSASSPNFTRSAL